jgi:hypothetical protein
MDEALKDIHRPLVLGDQKLARKWLLLGGICLVCGVVVAFIGVRSSYDRFMTVFAFALGGGLTLYGLFRMAVPGKPLVVMFEDGLWLRIPGVKAVIIPWSEIHGVESVDITGTFQGHKETHEGVTVVLVSRAFYDRHIHVGFWLMRGPAWEFNFVPQGEMMQVALHHDALPATAEQLRRAAETRWRAFGQRAGG